MSELVLEPKLCAAFAFAVVLAGCLADPVPTCIPESAQQPPWDQKAARVCVLANLPRLPRAGVRSKALHEQLRKIVRTTREPAWASVIAQLGDERGAEYPLDDPRIAPRRAELIAQLATLGIEGRPVGTLPLVSFSAPIVALEALTQTGLIIGISRNGTATPLGESPAAPAQRDPG